ncbi:MAG: alanine racemase [Spirochaetaceae bacterium]|jgi:alanine racemase|nr:alanine racemase [Spirochaetaceae bacterium]
MELLDLRATRAIIHLDAFARNCAAVRRRTGAERRLCVPVKAGAYGHGALRIARAAGEAGAFCLAVATVWEGAELRRGGITLPVLLFSEPLPREIPALLENRLTPFVSGMDTARALAAAAAGCGIRLPVHLKIDTGMGRAGCAPEDAIQLARCIAGSSSLEYAGTATHFAAADSADPADAVYTRRQIAIFEDALRDIRSAGIDTGIVHAANSGAVILHPASWFDMVRPGILLYGYKTVEEPAGTEAAPLSVEPVMELKTQVTLVKKIRRGESLSYGRTWIAERDTTVALLPVGYADGLPRRVGNAWRVRINGERYPLAGRICMDQCLVDVGDAPVRRYDEVTVFGGEAPGADALAELAGTIPYEITCGVSARVPRIYAGNGD